MSSLNPFATKKDSVGHLDLEADCHVELKAGLRQQYPVCNQNPSLGVGEM